jgi:NitT/TauT family transport system substrate-binding protein
MDLARNHEQGYPAVGFHPFMRWGNMIVVPKDSELRTIADLRGLRLGAYSVNSLDWIVLTAAAQKLHGFDPADENEVTVAAPGLLNGLIERGSVQAILTYADMGIKLIGTGEYRLLASIDQVMAEAEISQAAPFLFYGCDVDYYAENPDVIEGFVAAYREALEILRDDPQLWVEVAKPLGIEKPDTVEVLREYALPLMVQQPHSGTAEDLSSLFDTILEKSSADLVGATTWPDSVISLKY